MKKKILYLTDLYYKAKGRNYYEEDLWLTGLLKDYFDVVLCHPVNSESFEKDVDLIIFRNTGGVSGFKDVYEAFVKRVKTRHLKTFNEFTGKADMIGKQYLLDLNTAGYPVIPTKRKSKPLIISSLDFFYTLNWRVFGVIIKFWRSLTPVFAVCNLRVCR